MIRVLTGAAKPSMPPKGEPRPGARRDRDDRSLDRSRARGPQGEEPDRLALDRPQDPVAHQGPARSSRSTPRATASGSPSLAPPRSASTDAGAGPRPSRSPGSIDRQVSRKGHGLAFHARWSEADHGLGRRRPGRGRGDLERRRRRARPRVRRPPRHPLRRRALARRQAPRHLRLRQARSSCGTQLPASSSARWKGTPGRSTTSPSAPTAASS